MPMVVGEEIEKASLRCLGSSLVESSSSQRSVRDCLVVSDIKSLQEVVAPRISGGRQQSTTFGRGKDRHSPMSWTNWRFVTLTERIYEIYYSRPFYEEQSPETARREEAETAHPSLPFLESTHDGRSSMRPLQLGLGCLLLASRAQVGVLW